MKSKFSKYLLIFTILFYLIFELLFIHPANLAFKEHGKSTYGKQGRHVLRVWRMARFDGEKPYSEVKGHFLFHDRNPGLFKFMAELSYRLGARSPIPLQVFLIFLVILGIIAQYLWLKEYFDSDYFPIAGNLLILGTHFLTFFGSTIHQHPYNFAFFNFSMFLIVRFVQTNKLYYFALTCLSYFILCQSYYMFWVSTFIMLCGVIYFWQMKLISKYSLTIGLVPLFSYGLLFIQISNFHGGTHKGLRVIEDSAKERLLDSVSGEQSFKHQRMSSQDWLKYPLTVSSRIERYFYIPGIVFLFLFIFLVKKLRTSSLNYRFLYFAVPAGLSWYLLVIQHTSVHVVAGRYSFFLWILFFGYYLHEISIRLKDKKWTAWIKYCFVFVLVYGGYGFTYINLKTLSANFSRIIEFGDLYEKAEIGDKNSIFKLFNNKFAKEYGFLDMKWLKPYNNLHKDVGNGIYLEDIHNIEGEKFLLFSTTVSKTREDLNRKLYINNVFVDLVYPNEYAQHFYSNPFSVINIGDFRTIEKIEVR